MKNADSEIQQGASFCPQCGFSLSVGQIGPVYVPPSSQPPEAIPPIAQSSVVVVRAAYAGFWLRALAFVIDNLILGFLFTIIVASDPAAFLVNPDLNTVPLKLIPPFTSLGFFVIYLMMWLYFALFEASSWQATPGKRILRLRVTDLAGQRPTFARATVRNLARIISSILFVGYVIAGFTEKKQALHDIIAGCIVLRRS